MRLLALLMSSFSLFAAAASAQNPGLWYYSYVEADEVGEISSCNVNFDFTNAFFSARISGEELDFVYFRDDFTLPYDQTLGPVIFRLDQVAFVLLATTNPRTPEQVNNSAQLLFLTPRTEDYGDLITAFRAGNSFAIEFPNGSVYNFSLAGTDRAFRLAQECWSSKPTGPFSNNPFVPPDATNNPFESL